ncbi:MAG: hypothetical protein ACHQ03_10815 [Candidatus Bathyarchaeia archaeon]
MRGTEVMLDLDEIHTATSLLMFVKGSWRSPLLFEWPVFGRLDVWKVDVRKTSHSDGYHVRLFAENKIPPLYLILIQLSLGSDPNREARNLQRIIELKLKDWNKLYHDKLTGRGDYTSHEKRPDKRTAKKIADIIKEWNRSKERGLEPF